jgi:hypothetical protein
MPNRAEEEPDEPDEPEQPELAPPSLTTAVAPGVSSGVGREYEYRVEQLSVAELTDGKTLPELLTTASAEGWDLVEIVPADDRRVILLRKPRRKEQDRRPVGFAPRRAS